MPGCFEPGWARFLASLATAVAIALAGTPVRAAELLYVADPACPPCRLFERQVAALYPKTQEARLAPLRPLPYGRPPPASLAFVGQARVAPTFILVDGTRELGRFEGYSSDELFWMNLTVLLRNLETSGPPADR